MQVETGVDPSQLAWDANGLIPCVTQDWATGEVLTVAYMNAEALARTLAERRERMPEGSYTARLFSAGQARMGAKVEEEAEEVVRAAREEPDERLRAEAADLLYHLGVVLEARGLSYADALDELTRRMGP